MTRQYPRSPWRRRQPQCAQECRAPFDVEAVQRLVEQQHVGFAHDGARQQHAAALAVRQRQECSRRITGQAHLLQHLPDASLLRGCCGLQRKVGIVVAREHDLRDVEPRFVAHVPILPLGTEVGDAFSRKQRLLEHVAIAQVIAAGFASGGRRPHVATQQLEQDGLAGAIRSEQQPVLTGTNLERNIAQGPVPAEPDARVADFDALEPASGRHGPAHAASHVQRSPSCATRRSSTSFCR